MTSFEFWAIVIIGGSAIAAMLAVAVRMVWQQHFPHERKADQ